MLKKVVFPLVVLVTLLVGIVACGGGSFQPEEPIFVSYSVVTIDGGDLPYAYRSSAYSVWGMFDGSLILEDGTWSLKLTYFTEYHYYNGDVYEFEIYRSNGRYEEGRGEIVLHDFSHGQTTIATIDGGTLRLTTADFEPEEWVLRRN